METGAPSPSGPISLPLGQAATNPPDALSAQSSPKEHLRFRELALLALFPLVGLLVAIRTVAIATLPHILVSPDQGINYQEVTDRLPIPALLNWKLSTIQNLIDLRDMPLPLLVLLGLFSIAVLCYAVLRLWNPTYQPFVVEPNTSANGPTNHLSGAIRIRHASHLLKTLLLCGLPLLALWLLVGWFLPPAPPLGRYALVASPWSPLWALRLMGLGVALWIGFHPKGLMGSSKAKPLAPSLSEPHSRPIVFLLVPGLIWGALAWVFGRLAVPSNLEPMLTRLQALGTFNIAEWRWVVSRYLLSVGLAWLGAGALLVALGREALSKGAKGALWGIWGASLGIALWGQHLFTASALANRFDLQRDVLQAIERPYSPRVPGSGVPDGLWAAQALARRLYLPMGQNAAWPARSVLVFQPNGSLLNVLQTGYTINGLSGTRESALKTRDFLLKRRYHSALSWVATEHLYDCAALRFDTTGGLDVLLSDLSNGPHLSRVESVVTTLFFICAATPENHALLDKWANPHYFAYPDRFSTRLVGDLYRRFGDVKNALTWYHKADMPSSFMARIRAERPLFHSGTVQGVLRLNGKPLVGVRVGMMPWRMNGLPPLQELLLANAFREVVNPRGEGPLFPPFHPIPFAFRWVSAAATTNQNGAFEIHGLTEGQYRVLVQLPPAIRLVAPFDPHIRVMNPPVPFSLNYGNPSVNLGIIDIFYQPPSARSPGPAQSLR